MTSVKVYRYQWTHWDFLNDKDEQRTSEIYVTSKHIRQKADQHPKRQYAIIPDSEMIVDRKQVINGIFHPELQPAPEDPLEHELD
jgi:galactitol-specific phosphotransferase system IIB component